MRVVTSLATAAAACGSPTPVACTADSRAGVVVELRDARTGAPASVAGASLVVREQGVVIDSVGAPAELAGTSAHHLGAAHERAGVYSLTVRKPGYRDWTREDVRVAPGVCHVVTARLVALLERA
jgi:hypothetical protein